jgi:nucleoside-diphosphate-sugar epimerase
LRPSCIYGPGSEQWTRRIGRLLLGRRIGDLGPAGDGCCNLIYIDDMINAVLQALIRPGLAGEVFNVSSANAETWNQYFIRLGRALGATPIKRISPLSLTIETKLVGPTLKVLELAGRRLGANGFRPPAVISPSLARLWRHDIQLDERKADARLCFSRTPIEEGIAASANWLNSEKSEPR